MRTKVLRVVAVSATFFASFEFCAPAVKPFMPRDGSESHLGQFWEEPRDVESRDTFNGPWGRKYAPAPSAVPGLAGMSWNSTPGFSTASTRTDPLSSLRSTPCRPSPTPSPRLVKRD